MLYVDHEEFIRWALTNYSLDYAMNHMDEVLDQYLEVNENEKIKPEHTNS